MHFDDDMIQAIDAVAGWVDDDGSPSRTARALGYRCRFLDGPFSSTAWLSPAGVWSVCVFGRIETTLLAKSFSGLERLYRVLRARQCAANADSWIPYYVALWGRRHSRWCPSRLPTLANAKDEREQADANS